MIGFDQYKTSNKYYGVDHHRCRSIGVNDTKTPVVSLR